MALIRSNAGGDKYPFLSPMKCFMEKNGDTNGTINDIISGTPLALAGSFRGGAMICNICGFNGTLSTAGTSNWHILAVKGDNVTNLSSSNNITNVDVSVYDYIIASAWPASDISTQSMTFTAA